MRLEDATGWVSSPISLEMGFENLTYKTNFIYVGLHFHLGRLTGEIASPTFSGFAMTIA